MTMLVIALLVLAIAVLLGVEEWQRRERQSLLDRLDSSIAASKVLIGLQAKLSNGNVPQVVPLRPRIPYDWAREESADWEDEHRYDHDEVD